VIWQGAGLLALNKPPGLAVHGPASLDEMVRAWLADKLPPSLSFRPGPLHRLDRPTSGLIVFSASLEGARRFSSLLRRGGIRKRYLALAEGRVTRAEVWRDDLVRSGSAKKTFTLGPDGASFPAKPKAALTGVTPLAATARYTLLLAEISTGRTHQIRAQAAARGHPLAGDLKYGGHALDGAKRRGGGFFLHAWQLLLRDTEADGEFLPPVLAAPPPPDFLEIIDSLFGKRDWRF
jgi:23S rRNA pseudouridine955/2504/2580 synthase